MISSRRISEIRETLDIRKGKRLWITPLVAILFFSCGPRFSGEEKEIISHRMFLVSIGEKENEAPSFAIVSWSGQCSSEKDDDILLLNILSSRLEDTAVLDPPRCSDLYFAAGDEIRSLLAGHGYVPGEKFIEKNDLPLVGSDTSEWFRERVDNYDYYLKYSEKCTSLVRGSYGNREGAEIEHSYCLEGDDVTTVRSIMRVVHLEPFANF